VHGKHGGSFVVALPLTLAWPYRGVHAPGIGRHGLQADHDHQMTLT
jgi:hypothetical protein